MRFPLLFALLLVSGAALIGCSKKPKGDEDQPEGGAGNAGGDGQGGGPIIIGGKRDEPPPPWPPLPAVPARPKSFPETPGGRIAWALDVAAENLIVHGSPEKETFDRWEIYSFRRAFADAEKEIKGFPRAQLDKELFAPWGNATKERDLLDKSFSRLFAAWTRYWEMQRRWEVARSEELIHRLEPKWSPKKVREEAERGRKPGREVKINNGNYQQEMIKLAEPYDWYTLDLDMKTDASGGAAWGSRVGGTGLVSGRVKCDRTLTISAGPMAAVLSGSVGEELWLQGAPAVIDLTEFTAPLVRVQTGEDIVVRVGPGVKEIEVGCKRGVILARGNPRLRVRYAPEHHLVAVVGY